MPRLIFQADLDSIMEHFNAGNISAEDLETPDHRGNKPIHLAAKLSKKDEKYLVIVDYLLSIGAHFKSKDREGWTIIDEAISTINIRLLAIIFDHCSERKKIKWKKNRERIVEKLKNIPDFYMELNWQFSSSVIPFLAKFAPKDTYKIWKVGSSLRLDFTLVGFDKLKSKRREMSIIFRDASQADDEFTDCYLLLLNRTKEIVVDPLEELDYEEKIAVLQDILNSESIKADVDVSDPDLKECTTLFGNPKTSKVGDFKCWEYKLTIESNKAIEKKGIDIFEWDEDEYFNSNVTQLDHETRVLRENTQAVKKEPVIKTERNKRNAFLWLNDEFELKPKEFFTILETLQHGGNLGLQRMNNLLKHENLQNVLDTKGFPIKIEIPFGFTVNAKVMFSNFRYLKNRSSSYAPILPDNANNLREVFMVPDYLEKVSRKEGMKTMKNKKKRLAFANFNCS